MWKNMINKLKSLLRLTDQDLQTVPFYELINLSIGDQGYSHLRGISALDDLRNLAMIEALSDGIVRATEDSIHNWCHDEDRSLEMKAFSNACLWIYVFSGSCLDHFARQSRICEFKVKNARRRATKKVNMKMTLIDAIDTPVKIKACRD